MDSIGTPLTSIIFGAILLVIVGIAGGIGKATGETFGAHKARNMFEDLENKEKKK